MDRLLRGWVWGLMLLVSSGAGHAADAVVTVCNETEFNNKFNTVNSGGGTLTFSCTGTITFTSWKQVSANVVIDGANQVILSGNDTANLFQVFASGMLTLKRLSVQHAFSSGNHAIENFGTLNLVNVTLSNSHLLQASFVQNYSVLNVSASTFSSNNIVSSALAGVAIGNQGTATISDSTFDHNVIDSTTAGTGGAVFNDSGSVMYVHGSAFTANSSYLGAAIYSAGELYVVNSTFQGNFTAGSTGGGGAIYQTGSSNSSLDFATVVGNSASYGAGIYSDGATSGVMTVGKSIIAGNSTGNCDGGAANYVSGGYNVGTTSCVFFGGTDTVSANASVLDALANYGGPTQTMRLSSSTNPAYNKVPTASCKLSPTGTSVKYDQRWATRPTGSACDSGAYQHNGTFDRIFSDEFGF